MSYILIINQFASKPQNSFGAGERFFHLSKYFENEGYSSHVISGSYNHLFKVFPKIDGLFTTENIQKNKFTWVKLRRYEKESSFGRIFSWFEFLFKLFFFKLKERPSLVVVSSMSLLPIIYGIWLKKKYKSKLIFEIRDIWPLTAIQIGGYSERNPLIWFLRKVEILGYRSADHIVSVLPGFKKHLIESGFKNKNFTWIPNAIILDKINFKAPTLETKTLLPTSKFNIVYAGTFGKANALEYFIEAAKILQPNDKIHINLIGDGTEKEALLKLSSGLTNISFYPAVLKSEVNSVLRQADVCYIGWHGLKLYEYGVAANKYNDYMLAEKPILSSSNIKNDVVDYASCGLKVEAENPEEIAAGILTFYKMKLDELNTLGKRGNTYLVSNQVYSVVAGKYMDVFKEVLLTD
jgi:glycosyltransferase involved in cell wall biosynthesis